MESSAHAISPSQVPFHLLSPTAPTVTTLAPSSFATINVYFTVTNRYVVREPREVPPPKKLTSVIDALLKGPYLKEIETGVETSLNSSVKLLSTRVAGKLATVNFNAAFGDISGFQQVLAVAQVVYTVATELTTASVVFEIGGFQIQVPLSTGQLVTRPVQVKTYVSLLGQTPTPTTVPGGG